MENASSILDFRSSREQKHQQYQPQQPQQPQRQAQLEQQPQQTQQQQRPMFYTIGQTPPYPGMYAGMQPSMIAPGNTVQSSQFSQPAQYVLPAQYSQNGQYVHPAQCLQPSQYPPPGEHWQSGQYVQASQPILVPPTPTTTSTQVLSQRWAPAQTSYPSQSYGSQPMYVASQYPGPISPASSSATLVSPPLPSVQRHSCYEPLTPVTPGAHKLGTERVPAMHQFKVLEYNELSPGNGVKYFAQIVVEIFSTQPDESAFPLVGAMITREFNIQRRAHEENLEGTDLDTKDENGYYVCKLCGPDGQRYLHLKSLVRHTSTHFVTKPFSCLFCDDRFTRTDVARKHLLSCRALRSCLLKFGPDRAAMIQRALSSSNRPMPGMEHKRAHAETNA